MSSPPAKASVAAAAKRTLAVLQPGYLPWLGFFDQMRRSDVFVYYDDVQFDKHGWRNRNRIKSAQGPHVADRAGAPQGARTSRRSSTSRSMTGTVGAQALSAR